MKKGFLENFNKEPDIHVVFKDKKMFEAFEENNLQPLTHSGFIAEKKDISNLKSFFKGELVGTGFLFLFFHYIIYPQKTLIKLSRCLFCSWRKSFSNIK